jgi:hypothetical protein
MDSVKPYALSFGVLCYAKEPFISLNYLAAEIGQVLLAKNTQDFSNLFNHDRLSYKSVFQA